MVEKRDIEAGSWETLSLEDRVEKLKQFITSKFPDEPLVVTTKPEETSISTKKGRR